MTTTTPSSSDSGTPQASRYSGVHCKIRRSRRISSGFTLIEILVVISIIVLLIGIVTTGALIARNGAQRNRTQSMMRALMAAVDEHEIVFSVKPPHDVTAPAGLTSSETLVWACNRDPKLRSLVVASMQGRGVFEDNDGDGIEELYDPWDRQIAYRNGNEAGSPNIDGINHTDLPFHRDPFFVSAGKDGAFGTDDDISTIELGS
ncbi:MAG: prepilin-type N-terminal cleavage/methylation domain-containing protein [Planctomycetota bacterium]